MKRHVVVCALAGLIALGAGLAGPGSALADELPERTIVIKDHRFDPAQVEVPAGVRVKLVIDNQDATPEEFDSNDLRREKIVAGHSKGIVWVGPLPAGEYRFMGEYHADTAQGRLIAK